MTSTQIRPEAVQYPRVLEVTPRYSDLDPSRRVSRQALVRWFEDARITAELEAVRARPEGTGQLLVSVQVDVLAPLRIADDYRVGFGVSRIGRSSFGYSYAVYSGADLVATGRSTSVWVQDGRPAPLPAALRTNLAAAEVPGLAHTARADHSQARLVRENYPFRYDVRTRFGDIDTNRHVNNVALAGWYLDGLAELHTDVLGYPAGGPMDGLAPSSLHVEFLDEVHYPGIYQLRVGVRELVDGAVAYECGLFDGSRCIGLADATGSVRTEDGDLSAAFEPFTMRR